MNYTKGEILSIDVDSQDRFVFRVAKDDAQLFKAAPNMYKALKGLIKAYELDTRANEPVPRYWERAMQALAEAEGKGAK